MSAELQPDTVVEYLRERTDLELGRGATAESLGGGVSNSVLRVRTDPGCVVVKQPFPNLAVESEWSADVERVHNEAAAARAYAAVLDTDRPDERDRSSRGIERAQVPSVVFEDHETHTIGIECAPDAAGMWKRELLDGTVDVRVAALVGRVLAAVHTTTADDAELRETFGSKKPFDQLRIDPYHRTVARRHPDVGEAIEDEIDRATGVERTLVHGDYSPKNVLVDRSPAVGNDASTGNTDAETDDGFEAWILDFEVAHWGDPAFDVAFMLNHLFIKSVYNHGRGAAYAEAALAFWEAYRDAVAWDVERETVVELAVLMLARVDGKSPVGYIESESVAETLREVAKRALRTEPGTLSNFAALVAEERESL